jgi:hypothetical protein
MSIKVRIGLVTGIPWQRVSSSGRRPGRRCTVMPSGHRLALVTTETSNPFAPGRIAQSAAAESWLRTAAGPQASTAAIQHP